MDQLSFVPEAPIEATMAELDPKDIAFDNVGPEPTAYLMDSVRAYGVLVPIIVRRLDTTWKLIAGRRRLLCSLACEHPTIRAVCVVDNGFYDPMVSLSDHALRQDNAARELTDIEAMVRYGAKEKEIAHATGLSIQTIRARMRLLGLVQPLKEALMTGKITVKVAEESARLGHDLQGTLVEVLAANDKLTSTDVKNARTVRSSQARQPVVPIFPADVMEALESNKVTMQAEIDQDNAAQDAVANPIALVSAIRQAIRTGTNPGTDKNDVLAILEYALREQHLARS